MKKTPISYTSKKAKYFLNSVPLLNIDEIALFWKVLTRESIRVAWLSVTLNKLMHE